MIISLLRGGVTVVNLKVESGSLSQKLNGEDVISISSISPSVLDIQIGDSINYGSKKYTINTLPSITKNASNNYIYAIQFESLLYDLGKIMFMSGGQGDFVMTGNLSFFINLIRDNMNRTGSGWTSGTVKSNTLTKTLTFSNENCLQVLQKLCSEYSTDFKISESKVISCDNFVVSVTPATFQYGRGKGLYQLIRQTSDSKNIFTRLYPVGSTRNISSNYRNYSKRLKLSTDYIEQNATTYGVIEKSQTFEDIYPRFTGTVSTTSDPYTFRCSAMDFDINSYLMPGVTAKVHFNSGLLQGNEFDIVSYNYSTKEFVIKANQQEKSVSSSGSITAYSLPNSTVKPTGGDAFVLLDIIMPQTYIDNAETELLTKATEYLSQNSSPRVSYKLVIDPKYVKQNGLSFAAGDYLRTVDSALSIDKTIRIIGLTKDILTSAYTTELSDQLVESKVSRLYADVETIKNLLVINKLIDPARGLRNWQNAVELRGMVFDTDGYFDTGNIRPNSIETSMLSVGVKSQQLTLNCVIEPNYTGNQAICILGAGSLVHFSLESTPKTFAVSENTYTALSASQAYYIYARCTKIGTSGILVLDTVKRTWDSDPDYYYFIIGVLHSAADGVRGISLTYGQTTVNGRFIKTGRIQSADGATYFDLDSGDIFGKITFRNGVTDTQLQSSVSTAQSTANNAASTASDAASAVSDAFTLADKKRQNFNSQPVTPYKVGDTWTNGTNLYTCTTERLTGSFNQSDWTVRVGYDSTQTVIDGGIVSTGSLRVKDANGVEWGGMRGGTGTDGTQIAIWAGASQINVLADPNNAPFYVRHNGQMKASAGSIAGWTISTDALYTGTKKTNDGYSSSGITIAANGSIHAPNFYLNQDGSAGLRGTVKTNETGKRIEIKSSDNSMTFYNVNGATLKIDNDSVNLSPGVIIDETDFEASYGGSGLYWGKKDVTRFFAVGTSTGSFGVKLYLAAKNLPLWSNIDSNAGNWAFLRVHKTTGTVTYSD